MILSPFSFWLLKGNIREIGERDLSIDAAAWRDLAKFRRLFRVSVPVFRGFHGFEVKLWQPP